LILDFEKLFINGKNSNELLEFTSEMDYLLKNSDVVTVSVPSNEETNKMINKVFLEKMKKRSLLINTSRGSIVDEKEMIDHLEKNKEFWYAADVFMNEPSKSKDHFDSLLA
jgi:lactate dehydrogenase-like 2-hydroxyacid dehydrogenase